MTPRDFSVSTSPAPSGSDTARPVAGTHVSSGSPGETADDETAATESHAARLARFGLSENAKVGAASEAARCGACRVGADCERCLNVTDDAAPCSCDHGRPARPERPNPMGPHVQVVVGWLDDNRCLLPDPDGIAYRRTFTDWEECESKCRYCPSVLADEQEFRHGICGGCADDGMAEMRNG